MGICDVDVILVWTMFCMAGSLFSDYSGNVFILSKLEFHVPKPDIPTRVLCFCSKEGLLFLRRSGVDLMHCMKIGQFIKDRFHD